MGDFNYPQIDWDTLYVRNTASEEYKFVECLQDNFLFQKIDQPTRWRGTNNPNILDLVITDNEDNINNIDYQSPLGKSDHCVITFELTCSVRTEKSERERKCYHKGDYEGFKQDLQNIDWEEYLETDKDINHIWNNFYVKIQELENKYIPTVKFKNKKAHAIPLEKEILTAIKEKNSLQRKYIRTKKQEDRKKYNRIRNKVVKLVRKTRKGYERNIAKEAKTNPKRVWRYINSKSKTRSGIGELRKDPSDINSTKTENDEEKANILADFFSSVFTQEPDGEIPTMTNKNTNYEWRDINITTEMIKSTLKNLKPDKSPGPDNLHPRLLQKLNEDLATPLAIIFNKSLIRREIPDEWKKAKVSAIHKKGDKSYAGNYRPVSLTSVICKVMEKLVRDHIMDYMNKNDIFTEKQYGFMPGRSTSLQLLNVLDEWTEAIDNGYSIDCIYMDFQKAFDTVPHKRLINKLKAYGIGQNMIEWTKHFLTERKQQISVNGKGSTWHNVTSGIPQGSVIGPLMFIIYINDLPESVKSSIYMFADDTKIFKVMKRNEDKQELQDDLEKITDWTEKWLLKLHPQKCKKLHIGKTDPDPDFKYELMGTTLENVEEEKDIGVIIDNQLSFDKHISEKVKKANSMSAMIRRIFQHLDENTFTPLYKSLVRTHLEYAHSAWSPYKSKHIELIEGVQRRATKQIPNLKNLNYEERLEKLKLPSLSYRRLRGDMIEVWKLTSGKYDQKVGKFLKMRNDMAERSSSRGNQQKLYAQRSKLDLRKHSFGVRVVSTWNSLPEEVVNAKSINCFKNRLDRLWQKQEIYYDYKACLKTETYVSHINQESNIEDPMEEPALENNDK